MTLSRLTFTPRGAGALVASLVVLVIAFYSTNVLVFLVATFLLGVVLASLLQFLYATRGFGPEAFDVARVECSSLVKVAGAGLVSVRLTSRLPTGFYAEVHDPHSERLKVIEGSEHLLTWWAPLSSVALAYVVSPDLRGLLDVGPTTVLAHDPLGLAYKRAVFDDPWSIEALVQPASTDVGHPARLPSLVVGQTSLSARGAGSDFRGLREYQPTDELRHIAWTRSGQGTMYVREYERESQQDLIVLVDVGREMAMGSGYENALELSVEAAARALRVAFDEGGRGGLVLFADGVTKFVPPGRGAGHEFEVFRALTGALVAPRPSSLSGALRFLYPHLARATSLLAFSMPGDDPAKLSEAASGLRPQGHRLYVLMPDVEGMYPELPIPTQQEAFEAILRPEARRTKSVATALARTGASVGEFGRGGAVDALVRVYARDRRGPGWA
jgi:uncharacterized protein (DUF58 family)